MSIKNYSFIYLLLSVFVILAQEKKIESSKKNSPQIIPCAYQAQIQLKPKNLANISQAQLDDHWKLYEGYVKQVNTLNIELAVLRSESKGDSLAYADRRRRFGFEYNGMVLHEYYFANLKSDIKEIVNGQLHEAIVKQYGTFSDWKNDFIQAGKTRGIGWAILAYDPLAGTLVNLYITDHEVNIVVGFIPLLVMDVWEHAYMVDHKADGRADYITAFMRNINWPLVEKRYALAAQAIIQNRSLGL